VLVGRDEETRYLQAALAAAEVGRGGTVFLAGEAGIGKSRLVRETAHAARARGFAVLAGRSVAGGVPTPFRPYAEALASAGRTGRLPDGGELDPFNARAEPTGSGVAAAPGGTSRCVARFPGGGGAAAAAGAVSARRVPAGTGGPALGGRETLALLDTWPTTCLRSGCCAWAPCATRLGEASQWFLSFTSWWAITVGMLPPGKLRARPVRPGAPTSPPGISKAHHP
jgi:hypothetical protein